MINHPSFPYFIAALLLVLLPGKLRGFLQLGVPFVSFVCLQQLLLGGMEIEKTWSFLGHDLVYLRIDRLSLLFVYAFLIFSFLANLFALNSKEKSIHAAANLYVGSSIGAVLAGDLVTLFIFWEVMAIASAILIWNKDRRTSAGALMRYLLVHLTGGLFFFSGLLMKLAAQTSLSFDALAFDVAGWLIFTGFCVNAAVVPMHAWLPDAYPEGTPAASVYLSAFTTKVAVYAFARAFAGSEILIWLGVISAVYGVIFALMEDDMRKLLSYHIVCQIGYMICGIGLGTELGINAGTAHAVGNILFKGLLFMATGAVIYQTGKYKLSELGGLARKMPLVAGFFMVGALAISGFPLLNGYVSKSLLLKVAGEAHAGWLELILLIAAVGTFMSIALKLAYFAFWGEGHHSADVKQSCPWNMTASMAASSLICFTIGLFPEGFYRFFPFPGSYNVYTSDHVIHSLQLLAGTVLAFGLILKYLHAKSARTLDVDWIYRKGAVLLTRGICQPAWVCQISLQGQLTKSLEALSRHINKFFSDQSIQTVGRPLVFILSGVLLVGLYIISQK